jgi:acetyl-CoA carboxylase, biotin carboxylase subunit
MVGKLIVWAVNRTYALERMRRVLYEYKITGVKTNIGYLRKIMDTPDFVNGNYDTHFIEKNNDRLTNNTYETTKDETEDIAIIAAYMDYIINLKENAPKVADTRPISRWKEFGKRNSMVRI